MEGSFSLDLAIQEPAVRHAAQAVSEVRADANRVLYSPLVAVTVSQIRKIPFGCLGTIGLTEEWFPVRDVPSHARHRVTPDPNDPSTWRNPASEKLPQPVLASVLSDSDKTLSRVLAQYGDYGCREIVALRDKTATEIRDVQFALFGPTQIRTYLETAEAINAALQQHSKNALLVSVAREIRVISEQAMRACELYWNQRKIEIMRAANGDKTFTAHPDNYDLRLCEYAGIDPTMTEAESLRADVLRRQIQPVEPAGPAPQVLVDAMRLAVTEGVKEGVTAAIAALPKLTEESKPGGRQQR